MVSNLISNILPYYKKKKYISKTLDSISKQTFKNYELIIIYDDVNKDDLSYLKSLTKKFKRIKFIINKKNMGVGISRNKGIKYANGEYLAFIDADDIWKKNKLKYQIQCMLKNNYDFTFTSYELVDDSGNFFSKRVAPKEIDFNQLLLDCKIGLSTVMIKKKILSSKMKFPNLTTKEDLVLWLLVSKKHKLMGIPKVLTKWRKTKNSLSSNSFQKLLDGFEVYNKYMNFNYFKSLLYLFILSINYLKKA